MKEEKKIRKRKIKRAPDGSTTEEVISLERSKEGVEQTTEAKLAQCPNCGQPLEDLSEDLRGGCAIEGCAVDTMCQNCAVVTECGRIVCPNHSYPIPVKFSDSEQSTIVACEDHQGTLRETAEISFLKDIWTTQKEAKQRRRELLLQKQEVEARHKEAIMPLLVAYHEGALTKRELRLQKKEIDRRKLKDKFEVELKREAHRLVRRKIDTEKEIADKEIEAKLIDIKCQYETDLAQIGIQGRAELRKQERLEHDKKMDRKYHKLDKERVQIERKKAEDEIKAKLLDIKREYDKQRKELSIMDRAEDRKAKQLELEEKKALVDSLLQDKRIEADKTIAKEQVEAQRAETKRKERKDSMEADLKNKRIDVDKEIAKDEIKAKIAELKQKFALGLGRLGLEEKAEERRSRQLEHKKSKEEAELDLKDRELDLRGEELDIKKSEVVERLAEAEIKRELKAREQDIDFIKHLQELAHKQNNAKAKRSLEYLDIIRKEGKSLRDYTLEVEKLRLLKEKLQGAERIEEKGDQLLSGD